MGPRAVTIVRKFFPDVNTVEDAKKNIEFEVTPNDAKTSKRRNHNYCAAAEACKRSQHADGVILSVASAYVIKGKKATRYRVPESVSREIVSFDRDTFFEPGVYRLNRPSPAERLGARRGGEYTTPGAGKKRKGYNHITGGVRTTLREIHA